MKFLLLLVTLFGPVMASAQANHEGLLFVWEPTLDSAFYHFEVVLESAPDRLLLWSKSTGARWIDRSSMHKPNPPAKDFKFSVVIKPGSPNKYSDVLTSSTVSSDNAPPSGEVLTQRKVLYSYDVSRLKRPTSLSKRYSWNHFSELVLAANFETYSVGLGATVTPEGKTFLSVSANIPVMARESLESALKRGIENEHRVYKPDQWGYNSIERLLSMDKALRSLFTSDVELKQHMGWDIHPERTIESIKADLEKKSAASCKSTFPK